MAALALGPYCESCGLDQGEPGFGNLMEVDARSLELPARSLTDGLPALGVFKATLEPSPVGPAPADPLHLLYCPLVSSG